MSCSWTRLSVACAFGAVASLSLPAFAQEPAPEDRGPGAVPGGASSAAARPAEEAEPAAQPEVTWPEVTNYVPPDYPPQALEEGREAEVTLKLRVEKDGSVSSAEVMTPVGFGFDEAALAAAKKLRFTPGLRDGKPAVFLIPYRYAFSLKDVERVVDERQQPPTLGALEGRLLIAGSEAPLAGIEITLTAPDGQKYRVRSGSDGAFSAVDLPPGTYVLEAAPEGFVTLTTKEDVVAGEATVLTYRLSAETAGLEVIVTGERPPREVTRRTIERREIQRVPGTSGDALRSIQSLPGVARPPGLAGLLIVRGSAPQDTNTFIDGSVVPLIYHFGGLSSVVPTELIDQIDFYPGNFSARFGRVMGGIVDVRLREPNTTCTGDYGKKLEEDGCFHGMIQGDLIDTRLFVQGPIGEDWTFAVGGRRSWVDVWVKPVLEEAGAGVTSAPVYHDYQVIAETKPSDKSRLSLRFYGSNDLLEIIINEPFAEDPGFGGNLTFSTGFWRGQAVYETELSPSVELNTMVSIGEDRINFGIGQAKFKITAYPLATRSEFGFKLAKGVKLYAGMESYLGPFDLLVRAPEPPRPGEPQPGPFTTRRFLEQQRQGTVFRPAWYGEAEITPNARALIVPGIRVDYARDSGHSDLSPRINGRYDLIGGKAEQDSETKRLRTTLKAGVGLFYQPPDFQETDEIFGTPGIESDRSVHYSVGVEQELTKQIEIGVEGYYKDLDNLVSRSASLTGTFDYNNEGRGYVIGAETLLKYKPDERFFGWLAYTLSRSVRRDAPDADEYLFQFDQTHILTALGSYRLGRGWEFGARFRLVSGPLDTPVGQPPGLPAIYAADAAAYTPLQGEPFSERLPLFHQLDIRVDKAWQFKDWRLSTYLDILNVYNHAAKEGIAYNYDYSQRRYQSGLPLVPSLGVRGEF